MFFHAKASYSAATQQGQMSKKEYFLVWQDQTKERAKVVLLAHYILSTLDPESVEVQDQLFSI
jgi:hypothetical protein